MDNNEMNINSEAVLETDTTTVEAPKTSKKRTTKAASKNTKNIAIPVKLNKDIKTVTTETLATKGETVEEGAVKIIQGALTDFQFSCLKTCLGWDANNMPRISSVKGEDQLTLFSPKNSFFASSKPELEDMVAKGIFEKATMGVVGAAQTGYRATDKGIQLLESIAKIKIVHMRKRGDTYYPVFFGKQK